MATRASRKTAQEQQMTQLNDEQIRVLKLAVDCILEAVRATGPMGAPSGIVYSVLMARGMTLSTYQAIITGLVEKGAIELKFNCLHPGPGGAQ
jgi:hypothetical protein